jgi:hypothetical protein
MRAAHERSGLAAPQVKGAMRLAGLRGFSPSYAFEQDGMDNWQECPRTCHGIVSRRQALNMQMGLGHEDYSLTFPLCDHGQDSCGLQAKVP